MYMYSTLDYYMRVSYLLLIKQDHVSHVFMIIYAYLHVMCKWFTSRASFVNLRRLHEHFAQSVKRSVTYSAGDL